MAHKMQNKDFYIPASVRHLGQIPLYRIIAWWGYYLGREFNRDDVSKAFRIDTRRAGSIMNYLQHRQNVSDIHFSTRKESVCGAQSKIYIKIIKVEQQDSYSPLKVYPSKTQNSSYGNNARQIAHWVLTRPVNSDSKQLLQWKKSCPITDNLE